MNKFWAAVRRNRGLILSMLAGFGVVGTGYLAFRAGQKWDGDWKVLIPPIVVGGVTIVAIVLNHTFGVKELAAITAAGSYVAVNRDELEKKLKEVGGEDAVKELRQKAAIAIAGNTDTIGIELTGKGDLLCFEAYSGRLFRASQAWVEDAMSKFDADFRKGYAECFNDLYNYMNLRETHFGHQFGYPAAPWLFERDGLNNPNRNYPYDDPYEDERKNGFSYNLTLMQPGDDIDEFWVSQGAPELKEPMLVIDIYTYPMECWMEY